MAFRFSLGILLREARDDRVQIGLGLIERNARFEPPDGLQKGRAPGFKEALWYSNLQRRPQVNATGKCKSWRHHADDGEAFLTQHDCSADDLWIGVEAFTP